MSETSTVAGDAPAPAAPPRDWALRWLVILWFVFTALDLRWVILDRQPQAWDQANHLLRSADFTRSFEAGSWSDFKSCWMAEYGPQGAFTYPPVYHLLVGLLGCLARRPEIAAAVVNGGFLALMMYSLYRLGQRLFRQTAPALAAAALAPMYLVMGQFQHEAFIDYALTAMATWCAWRLCATQAFTLRRASVGFGIAMGLGLLTKQAIAVYMAGPVAIVLVWNVRHWTWRMWLNVLLATLAMLAIVLPWYGPHWHAVLNTARYNHQLALLEGHPLPWTMKGAFFYASGACSLQMGLPLFALALLGAAVTALRLFRPRPQEGADVQDARRVVLTWLVVSYLLLTFGLLVKDCRYAMPLLPAAALATCSLATWFERSRAQAAMLVLILAAALPYFLFITLGLDPLGREIAFSTGPLRWAAWEPDVQYGVRPSRDDWHIPQMLRRMQEDHADGRPIRVGIVPNMMRYNRNSFELEALEHGMRLEASLAANLTDLGQLSDYEFVIATNPVDYHPVFANRSQAVCDFVTAHPESFAPVQRYRLPNGALATLYRVGKAKPTDAPLVFWDPQPPEEPPAGMAGCIDVVRGDLIGGWAWDAGRPQAALQVQIFADGQLVGTAAADGFRKDLLSGGIGDGRHSFRFRPPGALLDGQPHAIRARVAGARFELKPFANLRPILGPAGE